MHLVEPILSVPILVGQLIGAGYNAKCLDLNAEFFDGVLNSEYIKNVKKDVINLLDRNDILDEKKDFILKLVNNKSFDFVIKYIDEAVKVYRSEDFYMPKLLFRAFRVISKTLEILSAITFPYKVSFSMFENISDFLDMKAINKYADDSDNNIFCKFFSDNLNKYIDKDIDLVGISVTSAQNILPAFTLAKMIKKRYKAKVCIGGNAITRCAEAYKNHPDIFKEYCDYILIGEGEKSIVELAKYIEGVNDITNIPGLITVDENKNIVTNRPQNIQNFDGIFPPSFEGINFKKYLTPSVIIPIQSSKGCYWGKCTFCDYFHGEKYFGQLDVETVVKMIKSVKDKYGINNFEFTDEAMTYSYLDKLSDALLKEKLDIKYHIMIRTEKEFTKELFEKAYKSGLRLILLGYESHSERIIKLMNKGVENVDRIKILKNSAEVGIWNFICLLFGYPLETDEEWMITEKFLFDYQDIIDNDVSTLFRLDKHSKLTANLQETNSSSNYGDKEFSKLYTEESDISITKKLKLANMKARLLKTFGLRLWQILIPGEYIFLYVAEKGRKYTKETVLIEPNDIEKWENK